MQTLQDFFQTSIFCSGTPADYQRHIAEKYSEYAIDCSLKEAIENHYVLKPCLNLVHTSYKENFAAGIKAVFENELELANVLNTNDIAPRIIINCNSIDEINSILKIDYFNQNIGKLFHTIAIHTDKLVVTKEGNEDILRPTKDGIPMNKKDLMDHVQNDIDNNTMFNDNLPILLFQVATMSEGINLKSFSATIIITNEASKAMQQIGRVIRHYKYGNHKEKQIANVYLMNENFEQISMLIYDLKRLYTLTDECFEWRHCIEPAGSCTERSEKSGRIIDFTWKNLKDNSPEIIAIQDECERLSIKENKQIAKDFQIDVVRTEALFNSLINENKLTIEEEDYFFKKYYSNELFRVDKKKCNEFYLEMINR